MLIRPIAIVSLLVGCGSVTKENNPYAYESACGSLVDESAWAIVSKSEEIVLKHLAPLYSGDVCLALSGVNFELKTGSPWLQELEGNRVLEGYTNKRDGKYFVLLSDLPIQWNAYAHEVVHVLDLKLDPSGYENHELWEIEGKWKALTDISLELETLGD